MSETMSIYAMEGDKVRFTYPNNGYNGDKEKAKEYLVEGRIYTVDYTEVHSWITDVYLKEVPDISFNTVMFSGVVDEKDMNFSKESDLDGWN